MSGSAEGAHHVRLRGRSPSETGKAFLRSASSGCDAGSASNHVQSMDTSEAENDVPKEQHLAEVQAALEGGTLDTTAIPEDEVRQDGD